MNEEMMRALAISDKLAKEGKDALSVGKALIVYSMEER